jgi:hypothetical protein
MALYGLITGEEFGKIKQGGHCITVTGKVAPIFKGFCEGGKGTIHGG